MKSCLQILVLFSLMFFSCSSQDYNSYNVKYQIKKYDYNYGNCDSMAVGCVELKASYPIIIDAKTEIVRDSINRFINNFLLSGIEPDSKFPSLEDFAASLTKEYKAFKMDFPDSPIGYAINNDVKVVTDSNGLLSLSLEQYSFLGGAHPNTIVNYANFDLSSGKIIYLKDLFTSEGLLKLNKIAEQKFLKIKNLTNADSLENKGYSFEGNKFTLNENFSISKEGLSFLFNSYEIASYAEGRTEINISFEEIKNLLTEKSILTRFINK